MKHRRLWSWAAALTLALSHGCSCGINPPGEDAGVEPDVVADGGEPDVNPDGGEPDVNPDGGEPDVNPDGGEPDVNPDGGEPDVNPDGGEPDDAGAPDLTAPVVTADPSTTTFNGTLDVTLTADEPATIYYTTDGSTPTTASTSGDSPVSVSLTATTTLMFFGIDDAGNEGDVVTETYTTDDTAPTFVGGFPAESDPDLGIYDNLRLTFSEAMDAASVDSGLALHPLNGTVEQPAIAVATHWSVDGDEHTVHIWPAGADADDVNAPFANATDYVLRLTGATDVAGNALADSVEVRFTTQDNTPAQVVALSPDPSSLASPTFSEVSVTFDVPMNDMRGEANVELNTFGGERRFTLDDADLSWNAARTRLTLTMDAADLGVVYAAVRFSELEKENGARSPDVYLPITVDRSGDTTDDAAPLLDSPRATGTATLDVRQPYLWFSESLDPATVANITVTEQSTGASVDVTPRAALIGRAVRISLENLAHDTIYELHVPTSVLDAAGNGADAEVTQAFQLSAPSPMGADLLAVEDGAADVPTDGVSVFMTLPVAADVHQVEAADVRFTNVTTGAPVRGAQLEVPPVFAFQGAARISFKDGAPDLAHNQQYTLDVDGVTGVGGAAIAGMPFSRSFETMVDGGNARPIVDAQSIEVALEVNDSGVGLSVEVLVYDDNDTTVSVSNADGTFSEFLDDDGDGFHSFAGSVDESFFADGETVLTVSVFDGTHTVEFDLPVYRVSEAGIPVIDGDNPLILDAADLDSFTLTWSHDAENALRQVVYLASTDGGPEPDIIDLAVIDGDATSFELGPRFGAALQPGSNYLLAISKQFGDDGRVHGSVSRSGDTLVFLQVRDPALGSVSGDILLDGPSAGPVVAGLFAGTDFNAGPIAFVPATATANPLVYTYTFVNLDEGDYTVFAVADVDDDGLFDDDADGDNQDDVSALSNLVTIAFPAARDATNVDLQIENGAGEVVIDYTIDDAVLGDVTLLACPAGAGVGPGCDQLTQVLAGAPRTGAFRWRFVPDGSYDIYAMADVNGDGGSDFTATADPSPADVAGDVVNVTLDVNPPNGSVFGVINLPGPLPAGGSIGVAVMPRGAMLGGPPLYFAQATPTADPLVWAYTIGAMSDGAYDVYAAVFDDGQNLMGLEGPAPVDIVGENSVEQDFNNIVFFMP